MTPPRRVLLVEDSADDIELISAALVPYAAGRLDVVRDGAEAMEYLCCEGKWAGRTSGDPSVTILDLKLPKVGGLEVLRQIRAHPRLGPMPVVVLTSSRQDSDVVHSYALGTNAYVVKPTDYAALRDAVRGIGEFWTHLNEPPW